MSSTVSQGRAVLPVHQITHSFFPVHQYHRSEVRTPPFISMLVT